ncbi:MAG: GNAT family N-acetyltransferase [Planctomycetes bacterium]|nr:GNAT family N-acetyltransferase [Planctomycetota bacterium]
MLLAEKTKEEARRLALAELGAPPYERLARAVFGDESWEAHLRYCRWLFEHNPVSFHDSTLPIYVFWVDGQPVGQLGVIPVDIRLEGEARRAGWTVDFFILPAYQRRGIGGKLLRAAFADYPLLMSLGQTEASCGLFTKSGWRAAGTMTIHRQFLRPARCVAQRLRRRLGLGPPRGKGASASPQEPVTLLRAVEVADWPASADWPLTTALPWSKFASEPCIPRTPAFMRWRYLASPAPRYVLKHLRIGQSVSALAVWRVYEEAPRRGSLVDLLYPPKLTDDALRRLVVAIQHCMRAAGVELFECQTSDEALLRALPSGAFARRRPGVHFLYGCSADRVCPVPSAAQWRLYAGDCDVDAQVERRGRL